MSTKKKSKVPKYIIHKNVNNEIMKLLNEHLDDMTNPYDDKNISKRIFDCLNKSYKESQKIHHEYILTDLKKIKHKATRFFDNKIRNYIIHNLHYQYDISFQYKNIDFFIHIAFSEKLNIQEYLKYIKWVICLCLLNVENEKKETMNITLYLTSLKKNTSIPFENKITPIHINSGFTSTFGNLDICIFRKEEWLKVLIHECFHVFNMDFHEEKINFKNLFQTSFFIDSEFLVVESFVEFWARVLNCAIFSYTIKPNINLSQFHTLFTLNLNLERVFSLIQANKLLNLFQLNYSDIINKKKEPMCKTIYKEDTNAFCYYIITSIMMNYFDKTLQWFDAHNTNLFWFDKNERQVVIFCHYLKQLSSKFELVKVYDTLNKKIKKINDTSLKMTLFDIQL